MWLEFKPNSRHQHVGQPGGSDAAQWHFKPPAPSSQMMASICPFKSDGGQTTCLGNEMLSGADTRNFQAKASNCCSSALQPLVTPLWWSWQDALDATDPDWNEVGLCQPKWLRLMSENLCCSKPLPKVGVVCC